MKQMGIAVVFLLSSVSFAWAQQREAAAVDTAAATAAAEVAANSDASGVNEFKAGVPGFEDATLPVLALGTEGPTKGAPVFAGLALAHTTFYQLDGASLSIMAQGTEVVDGGPSTTPAADNVQEVEIIEDDGRIDGAELNFVRFGVSYTLRLTCAKVDDERCREGDFLESVYASLIVVEDGI